MKSQRLFLFGFALLLCVAGFAQGQQALTANVAVTEARTDTPFSITWGTVMPLAGHIFAQPWLKSCKAVWSDYYPSPARLTTVYDCPAKGDSLTPVNDVAGQRPCWVFWKEKGVCGAAVERGDRGNFIVSTFTIIGGIKEVVHETTVERTRTEYVETPGRVDTVFVSTRGYIPPAGITAVGTTNLSIPSGHENIGPEEGKLYLGFRRTVNTPAVCPPKPPNPPPPPPSGPTCPPGTPNPPNPPSSPEVNVPPHDPSTPVVPGGDSVPPGVGPPPPAPPDHGIITPDPGEPPTPPHMPTPDGEHQADPVDPTTL